MAKGGSCGVWSIRTRLASFYPRSRAVGQNLPGRAAQFTARQRHYKKAAACPGGFFRSAVQAGQGDRHLAHLPALKTAWCCGFYRPRLMADYRPELPTAVAEILVPGRFAACLQRSSQAGVHAKCFHAVSSSPSLFPLFDSGLLPTAAVGVFGVWSEVIVSRVGGPVVAVWLRLPSMLPLTRVTRLFQQAGVGRHLELSAILVGRLTCGCGPPSELLSDRFQHCRLGM